MKDLLAKVKRNGIRWFIARLGRELRNPSRPIVKTAIDGLLRLRRKVSRFRNKESSELLLAIYDLDVSGITFNFVEFLIDAEYETSRLHREGFIVVFVPSSKDQTLAWKEYDSAIDSTSRQWRFENILVPLTFLSEKCRGMYLLPTRSEAISFVNGRDVHPALYDGVNLRSIDIGKFYRKLDRPGLFAGLRASKQGLRYVEARMRANGITAPIVTITFRNSAFDSARNSNLDAWSAFARYLRSSGYHPVIVPDTDTAFQEDGRFTEIDMFRECAWNIGLRMALYESALLNFFSPNGCATLGIFNPRCSYIVMNNLPEGSIVTSEEALRRDGYPIRENHRFASPNQRLNFEAESYENILGEFNRFLEQRNSPATRPVT
jgi:hypothetical protein